MVAQNIPPWALDAFAHLGVPSAIEPINNGLLNRTYVVTTDQIKYILQEIAPIFDVVVTEDSLAVCEHLRAANIAAPRPYKTMQDHLVVHGDGRNFRALHFIDGRTFLTVQSLAMAESAGRVVGQFHRALLDFDYEHRSQRRHCADFAFHSGNLIAALARHRDHEFFANVEPLAERMLETGAAIAGDLIATPRHVHGDPKISNLLFGDEERAICLVDFDTLSKAGWSVELR